MDSTFEGAEATEWKRGLPPGKFTPEMLRDFEVYFSMGGVKWHRPRTEAEKIAYDQRQPHD